MTPAASGAENMRILFRRISSRDEIAKPDGRILDDERPRRLVGVQRRPKEHYDRFRFRNPAHAGDHAKLFALDPTQFVEINDNLHYCPQTVGYPGADHIRARQHADTGARPWHLD